MTLRVVVVNDYGAAVGGASNVALMQARSLAARGHEVSFFSAVPPDPSQDLGGVRHIDVGQMDLLRNPDRAAAAKQGIWNALAARRLRELLDEPRSFGAVVHLHSWTKALSSSVVAAIASSSHPAVCTLHDYFAACPNGTFFNFRSGAGCPLVPMSLACVSTNCDSRRYSHKLWRVARQAVQRGPGQMPRGIRNFICVSEFARDKIRSYLPKDATVSVIPTAIDVQRQPPLPADQRKEIVFVGRLAPEKGVETYVKACAELGIDPVILGDGELASWVREQSPSAKISGWLPSAELHDRLRGALALAFPTFAYESQALSVLEAAALGVSAIVSDHCAATSYVRPGDTGLLMKAGDHVGLARHMQSLLDNPLFAVRLGEAACAQFWAAGLANSDRCLDEIENFYRIACDKAQPRGGPH
ncbi:MAG TPA: glycosyltransferase family 4 protein [Solimonas sp.]|nr:glycosyltransferase family 4 protein [Solimonas sp.]